ncbi:MAG: biotin/lipoyl-containing protein [Candidatus Hermodarchaeota archaeon]
MTREEGEYVTLWFTDGSKTYEVEIHKASQTDYVIKVDDQRIPVKAEVVGPSRLHLNFDQYIAKCAVVKEGDKHFVFLEGEIYEFRKTSGVQTNEAEERADGEKNIRSPMPGRIIDICVKEGDQVKVNQDLIVIEAMKMETRLTAPCEATVKSITIKTGDQVDTDRILIELE